MLRMHLINILTFAVALWTRNEHLDKCCVECKKVDSDLKVLFLLFLC